MATTYTTYGRVRGGCGHRHTTRQAAERCRRRDASGCSKAGRGSYSDRKVVVVGSDGYLYADEGCEHWVPGVGGRSCGAATLRD